MGGTRARDIRRGSSFCCRVQLCTVKPAGAGRIIAYRSCMTDSRVNALVPYTRFLECQDRRRRIAAELTRPDYPPPNDADVMPEQAETASALPPAANNVEH
jgi:hypothetical protein